MSLQGKRVVITRATHQAEGLATLLREHGAIPILFPCIDVVPPTDATKLDAALCSSDSFAWWVLTSKNTVHILKQRLDVLGIVPNFQNVAAVGQSTAALFTTYFDTPVDFVPDEQTATGLLESVSLQGGECIVLPQSELADDSLAEGLRKRGAKVTVLDAYRNIIGTGGDDVPTLLKNDQIDAITFTSSSTVENFIVRTAPQITFDIPAVCIGPSTAITAHEQGYQHIIMPDHYTLNNMVHELSNYFTKVSAT